MVETILTPPHPDTLEALLDEPFARAFDHPTTQRQAQSLVCRIVDVLVVSLQLRIHPALPRCCDFRVTLCLSQGEEIL